MYTRIEWTSYKFRPPETVPEELYSVAKHFPAEFRRQFVNSHLLSGLKEVSLKTLLFWVIGACFVAIASLFDLREKHGWSNTFGTMLGYGAAAMIFFGILTAGSFLKYALAFRLFWFRVAATARDSDSYSEFLPLYEKCKTEKIGLDRELPFWVTWLVLIGIALIIYGFAVKFGHK